MIPVIVLQGALAGLVSGLVMSLWVGIGAQVYPSPPELTRPLPLTTEGCNFTTANHLNWTATAPPTQLDHTAVAAGRHNHSRY